MRDPTQTQARWIEEIAGFRERHGYCPTVEDLQKAFGVARSTAFSMLDRLRRRGWVTWEHGQPRTLRETRTVGTATE